MVKEIVCKTDGAVILVDDEDFPLLSRFSWYRGGKGAHPMTFIYGKRDTSQTVYMHQLILGGMVGADHIDRNVCNMQKANLRPATSQQNGWNKGKPMRTRHGEPASQFKGVSRVVGRGGNVYWRVVIKTTMKGEFPAKYVRLGPFDDEVEAARAYNKRIVELRGEYAWVNPIPGEDGKSLNNNDSQV